MRFASSLLGRALCAALFAGAFVTAVMGLREFAILVWLAVLGASFRADLRRGRARRACVGLLVQAAAVSAVVALAAAAPVKTQDRLLDRRVNLLKTEMSLRELQEFAEETGRRSLPVRVWVNYPESQADRVVRWPARELTLRRFFATIEEQTPLRHRFGSCGNATTILWGGNCCFGAVLSPPSGSG